ncbi:elongation factor Ts [Candidatus Woesebacteria bacterium]|nr:MAG: elongation factor Ts [Candidatus Woesebacteria bacterium]
MAKIDVKTIRKLRDETGASIVRITKVLDEVGGDEGKACEILKKEGFEKAAKRSDRETNQGVLKTYVHHSGKLVSIVELLCETDFVAKNDLFITLANDLAMQVASMGANSVDDLIAQDFIKDPSKKVENLVRDVIAKTGENVRIGRIFRVELGK